jgi:hypothetical protein
MTERQSKEKYRATPLTRREALFSTGAALTLLGGCDPTTLKTQNFRIMVEDEDGKLLGSGVWQLREKVPVVQYWEGSGKDGEAFPIRHPTHGKMYVTRGSNSGWGNLNGADILEAYQAAGLVPKSDRRMSDGRIGEEGFRQLARMKTRIELPIERTPCVVEFARDMDPSTVRIVITYSKTRSVDVRLRFFVQPTSEPLTTGILSHLPWLTSDDAIKYMPMRNPPSDTTTHRNSNNLNRDEFLSGAIIRPLLDAAMKKRAP